MSVPPDKLPGLGSIFTTVARVFSQTGTNVRDNAKQQGPDAKFSMGLQFAESMTALPSLLSKGFGRANLVISLGQGGYDLAQGMSQGNHGRTGSGVTSLGFAALGLVSPPTALMTGATYAFVNLVAPDTTQRMNEKVGQATSHGLGQVKEYLNKPAPPYMDDIMKKL